MLLRAQEMANKGRQVARRNEGNEKKVLRRKRRRKDLLEVSKSNSEGSFTHGETSSGGLSLLSRWSSCTYDDSSRSIDSRSEYYYSTENPGSQTDADSNSDSSYESSSRANTRRYPSDARGRPTGPEHWYPVYDLKILGEGSFAVVYLSYSKTHNTHFAVKCAKPFRRGSLKSLTKEADVLKQLDSPYIIEYLGERRVPVASKPLNSATSPKLVPMVTEIYLPYMKEGTLADEIRACRKKKQAMRECVIRNYTKQILSGLGYLHSMNIVHCDIKGSNILKGKSNLKISDFGVSKRIARTSGERGGPISRAGTRPWMAPEVHERVEQGFPADVWSLGCTVVQMISGKPPVTAELKSFLSLEKLAEGRHSDVIPKAFKGLSSECIDFLRKCFLKDTKARWTCEQLLDHSFLKVNYCL